MVTLGVGGIGIGVGAGLTRSACRTHCFELPSGALAILGVGLSLAAIGVIAGAITGELWQEHARRRPVRPALSLRAGAVSLQF